MAHVFGQFPGQKIILDWFRDACARKQVEFPTVSRSSPTRRNTDDEILREMCMVADMHTLQMLPRHVAAFIGRSERAVWTHLQRLAAEGVIQI